MSIWDQHSIVEIIKENTLPIEEPAPLSESLIVQEENISEEVIVNETERLNDQLENIINANGDIGKLVVDTAGFIRHVPLDRYSHNIYTTPDVIKEVRDSRAKSFLNSFPLPILEVDPTMEAYNAVATFAKETGDFDALSYTDLKVIALAYQLSQESGSELRTEPKEVEEKNKRPGNNNFFNPVKGADVGVGNWGVEEETGWITPENVKEYTFSYAGVGEIPDDSYVPVAIMTSDFAMQNVILQMNLRLVTIDGLQVRTLQKWTKRCYGCEYITKNMEDVFCDLCGGNTLEKISYTINSDGSVHYNLPHRSRSFKGNIYPIPKPKGGRNNTDLILRPDQYPNYQKNGNYRKGAYAQTTSFDDFESFGTRKNTRQAPQVGYGKKNPNQSRRKIGKKNKSTLRKI